MAEFNLINWKTDTTLIALYVGQFKGIGQFRRNIFVFQRGKIKFHSWDYVDLRTKLHGIPFNTKIKIVYKGMTEEGQKGKYPHMEFDVKLL